jgi:flagellar basal-body rod modification protein FlgD
MQNLKQSFSYSMGFSMMGKYISADLTDEETGEVTYVEGRVDSVRVMNGTVYAVVGDNDVPLEKITQVSDESFGSMGSITDYSNIIGMLGKSLVSNSEGEESSIEGVISSVTKEDDGVYANLDEVEIEPCDLDIGAFQSEEEYVEAMAGQEVTLKFEDEESGKEFRVTGTLRNGYEASDGSLRLILDGVKVPAGSIFSTKRVDLVSNEQLILNEILKELQDSDSGTGTTDDSAGTDSAAGL